MTPSYELSPADLASITDGELVNSTTRLLPGWEQIPGEFKAGNRYTAFAAALIERKQVGGMLELRDGVQARDLQRAVVAHLRSPLPCPAHKIAGVGLMLARSATLYG